LKKADLEKLSLKAILSKMVPYINFPYAEHTLRSIGVSDPNARSTERDIETLIKAAKACQELARGLET
jgi:dihydroxyacetone kinase